jgi:hypothetical protein
MTWLLQQPDTHLNNLVMSAAALSGHTALCKYLDAQQCPNQHSTSDAACGGHKILLRWMIDNGYPWDAQSLCYSAAQSSSVEVLTYLQELGILTSVPMCLKCSIQPLTSASLLLQSGLESKVQSGLLFLSAGGGTASFLIGLE